MTEKLNPDLSNDAWSKKRPKIKEHSVLRLNHDLLTGAPDGWSESDIDARGRRLADIFKDIWPGPESPSWGMPMSNLKLGAPQEAPETEATRDLSEASRARGVIAEMCGDGPGRVVAEALLDELLSWPDVSVRVKAQKEGGRAPRRFRVHGKNKLLGAFAYLYPKKEQVTVHFRLPKHFAEEQPLAEARDVKSGDPYQVRMRVPTVADIPEALELAQEAYEEVST